MLFTSEEILLMKDIGLEINFSEPSDDDWALIEEAVGDKLVISGFDENYEPNDIGITCENIIDKIPK